MKKNRSEKIKASTHSLAQTQLKPTRGGNVFELFFANYAKVIPGISDHEIVIVYQTIKPVYNKPKARNT